MVVFIEVFSDISIEYLSFSKLEERKRKFLEQYPPPRAFRNVKISEHVDLNGERRNYARLKISGCCLL